MKKLFACLFSLYTVTAWAQPVQYTTANAHSHNDYENPFPFRAAYNQGFGSMEADLHLVNDTLRVAHDSAHAPTSPDVESLYLKPLAALVQQHGGFPYADHNKPLQLLIDLKTDGVPTLAKLVAVLKQYPSLANNPKIRFVISGSRPDPATWQQYPAFIWFDGSLGQTYTPPALQKIALLSADFHKFTKWNGKGRLPAKEADTLQKLVALSHSLNKPVRFWATPDNINAWYHLMRMKVDFLNTDRIVEMGGFLQRLPRTTYQADSAYSLYNPTYRNDGLPKKVKNVILLIGDGTGLAHWYSGYTANHASLNVFNMRSIGLSKTSSYDNFITDSAPGATALSTGQKTNNRAVGVDHTGVALPQIPDYVHPRGMRSGVITSGDMSDATPASFYGHQAERSNDAGMFADLAHSPIQLLMGSGNSGLNPASEAVLQRQGFHIVRTLDSVPAHSAQRWVVADERAHLSVLNGRGSWLRQAFDRSLSILSQNKGGFFLMAEGAQPDHGAHDNNFPWLVTEVMDLDQLVGRAMEFADSNGETLVIVTADHETGGVSLMAGDYTAGRIAAQFATDDHTAIPVPVFAYGPQSNLFQGVYENTAIFGKILQALGIPPAGKVTAGKR
ncbi:alkaline phosphatase [Paraflavitalea pollutisoli]|uniref:alkaline phosphatase n=1 Tax=Paraflavitalea pollutisoli TaxID=3034143 RepID=UPI0023ECE063|nr:alkaline phosphatase [Paraflavitalea sp. H1-2-19X]